MLYLLYMAAAALDRCITSILVHLFMAVFAQFMCGFLETVNPGIAYINCMAVGTFINDHYFIIGMMADCASK